MGYTHYFPAERAFTETEWKDITHFAKKLFKVNGDILANYEGMKGTKPVVNNDKISFNGIEEEAHETFQITKDFHRDFNFCKTARKPYDVVVVALLCYVNHVAKGALNIGSDGSPQEWTDGRSLSKAVSNITDLTIPPRVAAI